MPEIQVNNTKLFYVKEGNGEETVFFSHGLLWSHKMFREQIDFLKIKYTVIAYDHRGQGKSQVSEGNYDMDLLTLDALALIDALVGKPVHFVGLSMGGFVGMRLAARYPGRIKSLILMETSEQPEPKENLLKYKLLNAIVRWFGVIPPVAKSVMKIMFAKSWLENPENKESFDYWMQELKSNHKSIAKSVEAVIYRKGVEEEIKKIICPTLIIVGDEDVATTPEKARFIQKSIPNSKMHLLHGAGHSSSIEKPDEINRLLSDWLAVH
ncbi:alpha/beta hydrolase [Rhodonellum psychrophilum GCM71 = DSM 17998]|uniref:Alpha/beta hydrolase n=2 Tax=Rhodonellum TaxID=336827 RepID=U5C174_9BACT|nr:MULTISPECIES: alpha/beta hydrolase [Rhodonellum]ERM83559.1 alpha/beta hydrolase [Rhodonellum psychrophilum GCM71 = DSM 17998]SDY53027.1 Pimeloyl-ACP methyl ester carboxylesterase [Rhodonellum ikkaensis]